VVEHREELIFLLSEALGLKNVVMLAWLFTAFRVTPM
jgi:hypothetical protein